jgi:5'(3')-deoxyribonucleotidase
MIPIKTVFLDMDGVLVDFTMGCHKKLGCPLDYNQWPYPKGPDGWDWNKNLGMTFRQLSALCDFDFWVTLDWTVDGHDILRSIIAAFDPDVTDMVLLTSPMPHIMSASGKMAWIELHLPEYSRKTIVCSAPKAVMARPDSLLIDDNQGNCVSWMAAGGRAILVPRCWNNLHEKQTNAVGYVQDQLRLYGSEV